MAVTTIVMGGIGSAILLSSRAVDTDNPVYRLVTAGHAVDQFAQELSCAISVTARSSTMIEFTVADRDTDGVAETIRYEWSGAAGDALTRLYNGGTAVSVADGVENLALTYGLVTTQQQVDLGNQESAETLLISRDAWGGTSMDSPVQLNQYPAVCFLPTLPADAVAWSITRVTLMASKDGSPDGETLVQVRQGDGSHAPTATVLAQQSMLESSLTGAMQWQQFSFVGVTGLDPSGEVCLVAEHVSDDVACEIRSEMGGVDSPNSYGAWTTDGGESWAITPTTEMLFYVYGTVTAPGGATTVVTDQVTTAGISLQVGPATADRLETTVVLLNAPVAPPVEVSGGPETM